MKNKTNIMQDITWELKNLDSLKDYIFNDLIGQHEKTKYINEAINIYAERFHEMKIKQTKNEKQNMERT